MILVIFGGFPAFFGGFGGDCGENGRYGVACMDRRSRKQGNDGAG